MRPVESGDLLSLHAIFIDPGVRRYLCDDEIVSREWVENEIAASISLFERLGCGLWCIFLADQRSLIGFCGYRFFHEPPELQLLFGLLPEHWSKGLATEAATAMIKFGFEELGFERIIASADAPNVASHRVMEKAGMVFEKRVTLAGIDTVYYSVAREK